MMEQDRVEKGQERAAGAALAAVDSEMVRRQEPAKDKAEVAADAVGARGAAVARRSAEGKTGASAEEDVNETVGGGMTWL